MKLKTLLSRSLLVAVGLLAGTSAWAQETTVTATLDHTAGAQWGSNTGASTVDAEKEHYNNDAEKSWAGCAYAKFSFSIPEGNSITKATLTYSVNQGGRSGRNDIIYYMAKGFDLDWTSFAGQTGKDLRNTSSRAGTAVAAAATGGTGDRTGLTQDVTNAVKAIYAEGQSYILFQWTGNQGGADLYGKGSSNAPTLTITTTSATVYNITFKEENGVAATVKVNNLDVTSGTTLGDGTYDFTATANGYKDYTGSFTVNGVDQEVSFTMTAKEVYSYTVKAVDGEGNNLGNIGSGTGYADEDVTYYYPAFVLNGTTLYSKAKDSKAYWSATGKLDSDNKEFTVTYGGTTISDVVYYEEGENIKGASLYTNGTFVARSSAGGIGVLSNDTITNLDKGSYSITVRVIGRADRSVNVYQKSKEDALIGNFASGTTGKETTALFSLTESTDIVADGGYVTSSQNGHGFDYIYIRKIADPTVTINAKSGLSSYSNAAAVTVPDGVSIYVANAKPETGATTIELTKVTDTQVIPAGQGVLLYKAGGGAVTLTYGGTYTGTSYSKNVLTGTGSDAKTVGADETIYALVAGEQAIAKVDAGVEISANKAYLPLDAALAKLNIVFDGTVTGIGSVQTTNDANATNSANAIYNLSGQRVNSSYKGVVVKGGKKYINK